MENSGLIDRLRGQSVLVTGASGFIGSHLCARLAAIQASVHAVSRSAAAHPISGVSYVRADVRDCDRMTRLLRECKPCAVFHMAGDPAAARDASHVWPSLQSNVIATVSILSAALEAGSPRVVLAGSLEEPRAADAMPSSPYALSKWASTAYGRLFGQLYDLPVAIGRLFMTYGPTTRDLHKLIPHLILSLLDGRSPRLSSGRREVDWVHVDDIVEGLLLLGTAPEAVGGSFDLGSGSLVSIREIAQRIVKAVAPPGGAHPIFDPALDRPFEQLRVAKIASTQERLGWRPRIGLDDGLARTVEWFRQWRTTNAAKERYAS